MAIEDWIDTSDYWDDEDRAVSCKFCDEYPLYWEKIESGWRLFNEGGEPHTCEEFKIEDYTKVNDLGGSQDP